VFSAVVRVSGAGRLADFRERLRWLLVRDPDAEDYTEHHAEGLLEYRFAPRRGIPFPAFTEASQSFPELRVEAEWDHDGVQGRAVIENGRVLSESSPVRGADTVEVRMGDEARLELALIVERDGEGWRGYAATAERHGFLRYRDGALTLVEPDDADEALEEVAFRLVDEWLWYDEEDAPTERAHYARYGYPVRGANLKSEKLAQLRRSGPSGGEGRHSTLEPAAAAVRDALMAKWQTPK
jgi:hypothetical protein